MKFPLLTFVLIAFLLPLKAEAGAVYEVGEITIKGNKTTKGHIILRAMSISSGDTILAETLEETIKINQHNIYNIGLFNEVLVQDSLENGRVFFSITVKERWYIFPIPHVGVEERTAIEWWQDKDIDRLVLGLALNINNCRGRNETLWMNLQSGYSKKIELYYEIPFIIPKKRIGLNFGYSYINKKEVGYGTERGILQLLRVPGRPMQITHSAQVNFTKQFNPRMGIEAGLGYKRIQPLDTIEFYNKRYLSSDGRNIEYYPTASFYFYKDERDVRPYPLKGFRFTFHFLFSGFPGLATTHFAKSVLSFAHHIPLSKRFNFAYSNRTWILFGKNVPYSEKAYLGYDYFIRGFEPYVIDGSFINLTKAEFKFAVIPRRIVHVKFLPFKKFRDFPVGLYLTSFADAGYIADNTYNNSDNTYKNKLLKGYGMGINFLTMYDTQIRVEYSYNTQKQRGLFVDLRLAIK